MNCVALDHYDGSILVVGGSRYVMCQKRAG